MPILHFDIESRSALDLRKTHAWRYAGHASTAIWCIAFAVDDAAVRIWQPGEPVPEEFHLAAREPDWTVVAFNAGFERAISDRILTPHYGFPTVELARWRCSQAAVLASALPADLSAAAAALDLPIRKDADGHALMLKMAKPRKPRRGEDPQAGPYWDDDPEHLARLCAYCIRDVEVERAVHHRVPPLSESEQALWVLDQIINRRGFAVDTALAEAGDTIVKTRLTAINCAVAALTEGKVERVSQVPRIKTFLAARGHDIAGVAKRNVAAVLAHHPGPEVEQLLRLRQEGGKASAAKLRSLLAGADDGRLHGTMRFHKSATGRWAGAGFQPQNLPRVVPADEDAAIAAVMSGDIDRVTAIGPPIELVASLSRSLITAAPGCDLISADYSSIESRLTAWFAGETWKLDIFRRFDATGDPLLEPYCVTATRIFGRPITPEDEEDRQIGKYCELAFGFGGGLGAFKKIAPDADFTDAQIKQFKQQWRNAHPKICNFWGRLFRMLLRVVRTGRAEKLDKSISAAMRDGNLYMRLPSGREIAYPQARVQPGRYGDEIVFKDNAKGWQDTSEWHGTFVENLVQGTARDLLAAAMCGVEGAGYPIVLTVHDELVCEIAEDFGDIEEFHRLVTELPAWGAGLPLAAKVSRRKRYAKVKAAPPTEIIEESLPLQPGRAEPVPEVATPVTAADLDVINAGLQREGIEPVGAALPVTVDREQMQRFVDALFAHASAGTFVSLRTFFEGEDTKSFDITAVKLNGNLGVLVDRACRAAARAAAAPERLVFCPPTATFTNANRAREKDLAEGLTLSVECDKQAQAARAAIERLLGPATVVVASGGTWTNPETGAAEDKLHLHYRLKSPPRDSDGHEKLKRARKLLAAMVGADPTNVPLVHPIRWPGSVHRKSEARLCQIIACDADVEIELDAALAILQAASPAGKSVADGFTAYYSDEELPPNWGELLHRVLTGESYHDPLNRLAFKLLLSGAHDGAVVNLLRGWMEAADASRDARWQTRFDDIPRAVATAREKIDTDEERAAGGAAPLPPGLTLTLDQWAARNLPAPDHLLGELLSTTSRMLLAADTGLGKTRFGIALGMRIAGGADFLHWPGSGKPRRVLYIDGEMSNRMLKRCLAEEEARLGTPRPPTFFALSCEDIPGLQPLHTEAGQKMIEAVIAEHCGGAVDLIIFDNIMALIAGNHAEEDGWAQTLPWIRDLTRRAIGQIWIHHTGHNTSRQYGTKTREWEMTLYGQADKVPHDDTDICFLLTFRKARERNPGNRDQFSDVQIALLDDQWISMPTSDEPKSKPSPECQKYLDYLCELVSLEQPTATLEEWFQTCVAHGMGIETADRHRFHKYKRELIAKNWISADETSVRLRG